MRRRPHHLHPAHGPAPDRHRPAEAQAPRPWRLGDEIAAVLTGRPLRDDPITLMTDPDLWDSVMRVLTETHGAALQAELTDPSPHRRAAASRRALEATMEGLRTHGLVGEWAPAGPRPPADDRGWLRHLLRHGFVCEPVPPAPASVVFERVLGAYLAAGGRLPEGSAAGDVEAWAGIAARTLGPLQAPSGPPSPPTGHRPGSAAPPAEVPLPTT